MDQFQHAATSSIDAGAATAPALPPATPPAEAPKVSTFAEEMAALEAASNALNLVAKPSHHRILAWAQARLAPQADFTNDPIPDGETSAVQEASALLSLASALASLDPTARERAVAFLRQRYAVRHGGPFRF